ncbi:SGNH/GDSL hydrolase family protein [Chitinophaga agrisoli]|uniref:SGNH/GDSL hydrolase family protein n=1 Tax=Chitinophaga agrisoli TaxID=2607653 RepID=A0A5B2W1J2_9BACT|nr:SGNH/GDSL hydrolase family protein [Chitinophaga agrisoli]KAA2245195.1 SGNH/GDSL hydrolase family protein [Chitinophaga agrisoli]
MPNKHSHIDPELIRKYLAGELDDKAMHALERQALDDPFLAEALEGYAAFDPDQSAHLADLQGRLAERANVPAPKQGESSPKPSEPAPKAKVKLMRPYYQWAAAAAIIVVMGVTFFWMDRQRAPAHEDIAKATPVTPPASLRVDSTTQAPAATAPAKADELKKTQPEQAPPAAPLHELAKARAPKQEADTTKGASQWAGYVAAVPSAAAANEAADSVSPPYAANADKFTADKNAYSDTVANALAGRVAGLDTRSRAARPNYVTAPNPAEDQLNDVVVIGYGTRKKGRGYRPPRVKSSHRIVVLGSSTAEGVGPKSPDSTWVNLFRKYVQSTDPRAEVINLAVGGYNTYKILPDNADAPFNRPVPDTGHNLSKALSLEPDIIIINMPSNDIVAGYSTREFLENLEYLVDRIHEKHIVCYITTTQPRNTDEGKRKKLQHLRTVIERQYRARSIDCWEGLSAPDGSILPKYNSGDGIHLNGLGHRLMFERVKERVKL